jgi:hypothetical protein
MSEASGELTCEDGAGRKRFGGKSNVLRSESKFSHLDIRYICLVHSVGTELQ